MMPNRHLLLATILLGIGFNYDAFALEFKPSCTTAREYITTLEFLRSHPDYSIPEGEARKIAERVAAQCYGSGLRFVRIVNLLSRAGINATQAVQTGTEFSSRTDSETEAFVTIFQRAFSKEHLDLDLRSSLQLARSLSTEFEGDVVSAREDFEKVVDFCASEKGIDLPKPQCGQLAARVAKKGRGYGGGISDSFLKLFRFLRIEGNPGLSVADALKFAEDLVPAGPGTAENFIQAYQYATSESGLKFDSQAGMKFARDLATIKPVEAVIQSDSNGSKL